MLLPLKLTVLFVTTGAEHSLRLAREYRVKSRPVD